MTREEAIKILRREIECLSHTKCEDCILEVACDPIKTTPYDSEYIEVYEMAISALSAEPCDDYISRKDAIQALKAEGLEELCRSLGVYPWNVIKMIPSVQPKKGEWIKDEKMSIVFDIYRCSWCLADGEPRYKFCPNCGARMKGGE